jgi:hypothetical protein
LREKVAGGWRRLQNEKFHNLHASQNIIRVIKSRRVRGVGHVARMTWHDKFTKNFGRKPEGKRPLARPACSWEENIRTDFGEIWWDAVGWIHM